MNVKRGSRGSRRPEPLLVRAALLAGLAVLASGCTVRQLPVDRVGDAGSSGGGAAARPSRPCSPVSNLMSKRPECDSRVQSFANDFV